MLNDSHHVLAYIGLGSNLLSPLRQVRRAIAELAQLPSSRLVAVSRLYQSRPMGPAEQPDYINAVSAVETRLSPLALLDSLQAIENAHQRQRGAVQWGPRTLDLDLLLYGDAIIANERFHVPRDEIPRYAFVLWPLAEMAPELRHPESGKTYAQMWEQFDKRNQSLRPIPFEW